jgi:UDP-N-acetylglucosamine--N-acetylmuramyl-(pentapeptide) pyrophosphoryl-undecaprenol N-acetylglucosamine transferase
VGRTRTHVGWYLEDRPGPVARAGAVVTHLRSRVSALVTAASLAGDADQMSLTPAGGTARPDHPGPAAPSLGPAASARLRGWLRAERPDLVVVDGADDVALLVAGAGVPVVRVGDHGRPDGDRPRLLEEAVVGILAPFPSSLAAPDDPATSGTVHVGLLSRFAGRRADRGAARRRLGVAADQPLVTVVGGRHGLGVGPSELAAATAATPAWRWHLLGGQLGTADAAGDQVHVGWVDDPWDHLVAADVVVAGASRCTIAEAAQVGAPLLAVPRRSPDRAECRLVDTLASHGAAVPLARWPDPGRWGSTLDAAAELPREPLRSLYDPDAARRAAAWVDTWAATAADAAPTTVTDDDLREQLEVLVEGDLPADRASAG